MHSCSPLLLMFLFFISSLFFDLVCILCLMYLFAYVFMYLRSCFFCAWMRWYPFGVLLLCAFCFLHTVLACGLRCMPTCFLWQVGNGSLFWVSVRVQACGAFVLPACAGIDAFRNVSILAPMCSFVINYLSGKAVTERILLHRMA